MQETNNDFAAFKNGVCVAIATVFEGNGADVWAREFYTDNAGCEIRILPRSEACDALCYAIKQCDGEIARCAQSNPDHDEKDRQGVLLGEMDWRSEKAGLKGN